LQLGLPMSTPETKAHSTASGSVIGPEVGVVGPRGVFSKLIEEHGEATRFLLRVRSCNDDQARAEFYSVLRTALLAHERAEASVLYATLRQYSSTLSIAEAHEREAETLETAVRSLDTLDPTSSAWRAQLEQLAALLQDHIGLEERTLFPAALAELGERLSQELRAEYFRVKPTLMNRIEAEARPAK